MFPERLKVFGIVKPKPIWLHSEPVIECQVTGNRAFIEDLTSDFHVPSPEEIAEKCKQFKANQDEIHRQRIYEQPRYRDETGCRKYVSELVKTQKGNRTAFSPHD